MQEPHDLYQHICSYDNLYLAYKKARKRKTTKRYVIDFEKDLENNLLLLRSELLLHSYGPKPLVNFTVRDPKTRKISKSAFRDRVVHHALCNVIEPIFEKTFIHDSYANRLNKGTLKAVKRFEYFMRKASKNNSCTCYVLKADIKKYFGSIDHNILLNAIRHKVKDKKILWLIRKILRNYAKNIHKRTNNSGKGMPLGNLTSQFFANIYLNELDKFIKHNLKATYYIRYVDDFVILDPRTHILKRHKELINWFLRKELGIELHDDKTKIVKIGERINFLGFRIFPFRRLLKKANLRKMKSRAKALILDYKKSKISYDMIYDFYEGWFAYSKHANTYNLRKKLVMRINTEFPNEMSTKETNKMWEMSKND